MLIKKADILASKNVARSEMNTNDDVQSLANNNKPIFSQAKGEHKNLIDKCKIANHQQKPVVNPAKDDNYTDSKANNRLKLCKGPLISNQSQQKNIQPRQEAGISNILCNKFKHNVSKLHKNKSSGNKSKASFSLNDKIPQNETKRTSEEISQQINVEKIEMSKSNVVSDKIPGSVKSTFCSEKKDILSDSSMITPRTDKLNDNEKKSKKLCTKKSQSGHMKIFDDPSEYSDVSNAITDGVLYENTIESDLTGQDCNNPISKKFPIYTHNLEIQKNFDKFQHSLSNKTRLLGFEQNNAFLKTKDEKSDKKLSQNIFLVSLLENNIALSRKLSSNSSPFLPTNTELKGLAFLLQKSDVLIFTICIKAPVTLALTLLDNNYLISIDIFASHSSDIQIYMM